MAPQRPDTWTDALQPRLTRVCGPPIICNLCRKQDSCESILRDTSTPVQMLTLYLINISHRIHWTRQNTEHDILGPGRVCASQDADWRLSFLRRTTNPVINHTARGTHRSWWPTGVTWRWRKRTIGIYCWLYRKTCQQWPSAFLCRTLVRMLVPR